MTKITILFCLFTTMMLSQNISGTLYDAEAPISGAKIMNFTSKSIASTDGSGNFKIHGKLKDTVIFTSLFHHTKQLVITASHFEDMQVFELKKILNELDEVAINGTLTPQEINEESETKRVNKQFKTDVKRNPHLYRRPNTNSGPIDFIEIGRHVAKLFKRKTSKETESIETSITSDDFETLFKSDHYFNDKFLVLDLNITKDYKPLFFGFCETKEMTSSLLHPDNKIYLIDRFLEYSEEFRQILKESQQR